MSQVKIVPSGYPPGQVNLSNRLRRLWSQLAMWRRDYIVSLASGFGDLKIIEGRLYEVTQDFGNVIKTFFGVEVANRMEYYFTVQASLLNQIAAAMLAGNQETVDYIAKNLYENVSEMSQYLATVNPYWDARDLRNLLYDYYRLTLLETVNIMSGNQEEAIKIYESLEDHILVIADYLTDGLKWYFT